MNQFTISIVQLKIFGLLNDNLYPSFKLSDTVSLLHYIFFSAKLFIAIFGKTSLIPSRQVQRPTTALLPNVGLTRTGPLLREPVI